ncbi:MAG: nucleoside monophosphate kinase [Patescibacteria group bacterium]
MNLICTGAPGSGKGTLAKQLEEFGYISLTPGALYRLEYKNKTEFGLKAQSYWGNGNLCPNEMTNELIKKTVESMPKENLIFDGYPRTLNQAQFLDALMKIDLVIDLNISDNISVQRLLRRREIENRPDDTEDVIRQRLKVYHSNNDEIIKYYSSDLERYRLINADRPREEVLEEVKKIIGVL